jgi:hypothetical protein
VETFMKTLKLALVALSFGMAGAAFAQNGGPPPGGGPGGQAGNLAFAAMRTACQADIDKLCSGKQGPDMRQCMTDNASKLSKECADARAKLASAMQGGGAPPR